MVIVIKIDGDGDGDSFNNVKEKESEKGTTKSLKCCFRAVSRGLGSVHLGIVAPSRSASLTLAESCASVVV